MKRLENVGYQTVALALLLPGLAAQAKKPIRTMELQPSPDAEVVLPGLKLTYNDDGSVVLSGHGTAKAGGAPSGFGYVADKRSGTYSTKLMDAAKIKKHLLEVGDPRAKKLAGKPGTRVSPPESSANGITPSASPGYYEAHVTVIAKDPPGVELAETGVDLSWYTYSTGGLTWTSWNDRCLAVNPTFFGTHWYTYYCANDVPWYENSAYVCNYNEGLYYNYDFGDPSVPTYVLEGVQVCGRNDACYEYGWDHQDEGEYADLIEGFVYLC